MWDQIIKWPEWEYTFKLTAFVASLVTILGIISIVIAMISLFLDGRRRAEERAEQRRSFLWALQGDTIDFSNAIVFAEKAYERTWTGEYRHSHVWPVFSCPMAEAALREPYLLSLNYQEIADLIALRISIGEINALVSAKQAVVTGLSVNPSEAATLHADLIDSEIRKLFPHLTKLAKGINKWASGKVKGEPVPSLSLPEPLPPPPQS